MLPIFNRHIDARLIKQKQAESAYMGDCGDLEGVDVSIDNIAYNAFVSGCMCGFAACLMWWCIVESISSQ